MCVSMHRGRGSPLSRVHMRGDAQLRLMLRLGYVKAVSCFVHLSSSLTYSTRGLSVTSCAFVGPSDYYRAVCAFV